MLVGRKLHEGLFLCSNFADEYKAVLVERGVWARSCILHENSHSKELKIQQCRGEVIFLTSTVFSRIIGFLKFDDSVNIYYMHLDSFGVS